MYYYGVLSDSGLATGKKFGVSDPLVETDQTPTKVGKTRSDTREGFKVNSVAADSKPNTDLSIFVVILVKVLLLVDNSTPLLQMLGLNLLMQTLPFPFLSGIIGSIVKIITNI